MSRIIRLLETVGQDADLHTAVLADALAGKSHDPLVDVARGLRGSEALRMLAAASPIVCCSLEKHDDDEDEEAPDREDEEIRTAVTAALA